MKIARIVLHPVTTPREVGPPSQHLIVRLETDDGAVGIGEMPDFSHLPALVPDVRDIEACLNIIFSGDDPEDLEAAERKLLKYYPGTRFSGKSSLIRCGIDLALHDLLARGRGRSVSAFLGGRRRDRIPVTYPIFRMGSPEDVPGNLEIVARKVALGFRFFRLYFGGNPDADAVFLRRVAERFGDRVRFVALDASGLFDADTFLAAYDCIEGFDFDLIESPVGRDDFKGMVRVRRAIGHPVSEHIESLDYAHRIVEEGAVDIFNVSISVAGGLRPALQIVDIAEDAGVRCLVGTTQETSVGTAGVVHLAAVIPHLAYASNPTGPWVYTEDVVRDPLVLDEGCLRVPDGPGLGVEIDERKLEALREDLSMVPQIKADFPRQ